MKRGTSLFLSKTSECGIDDTDCEGLVIAKQINMNNVYIQESSNTCKSSKKYTYQ